MPRRHVSKDDIRAYYTSTLRDYEVVWFAGDSLSMHFGYQDNHATTHADSLVDANRILADLAAIVPGDRVLDAGCGLGGTSVWLAEARQAHVTGIALGSDQVCHATRQAARRPLRLRPDFVVADFTCLPFASGSFDVVWAHESLCHADDKAAFFREAGRVLAPGGRVVVADFMLRRAQQTAHDRRLLEQWFDGWKLATLWTAAQHLRAAKAAALVDLSVRDFTPYTIRSHRRLSQRARRAWPIEIALQKAGLRTPLQHGNFVAALRQFETLENACWLYGVLVARKS